MYDVPNLTSTNTLTWYWYIYIYQKYSDDIYNVKDQGSFIHIHSTPISGSLKPHLEKPIISASTNHDGKSENICRQSVHKVHKFSWGKQLMLPQAFAHWLMKIGSGHFCRFQALIVAIRIILIDTFETHLKLVQNSLRSLFFQTDVAMTPRVAKGLVTTDLVTTDLVSDPIWAEGGSQFGSGMHALWTSKMSLLSPKSQMFTGKKNLTFITNKHGFQTKTGTIIKKKNTSCFRYLFVEFLSEHETQ